MGLMETLIRRFTPDQVSPRVLTLSPASPDQYPRPLLRVVATTWTIGISHFNGERNQIELARMYCSAVREKLLDEIEGVTRPSSVLLGDVITQTRRPSGVAQAFARLTPEDFDASYARLRMEYAKHDVDIEQLADAMVNVVDIMRYIAQHS
jgi:hypothetical protein